MILILMLVFLAESQSTAQQPLIARLPILMVLMVTLALLTVPTPPAVRLTVVAHSILILMLVFKAESQSTAQQPLIARLPIMMVLIWTLPLSTAPTPPAVRLTVVANSILILLLVLMAESQSTAQQPLIARLPILMVLMVTLALLTVMTLLVLPQP